MESTRFSNMASDSKPSAFGHGVREVLRSIASPIDTISALANRSKWATAATELTRKGINNLDLSTGSRDLKNVRTLADMSRNPRAMDNLRYKAARGDRAAQLFVRGKSALREAANDPSTAGTLLQLNRNPIMSTVFASANTNKNQLKALGRLLSSNSPYASLLSRRQLDDARTGYNRLNSMYNIKRSIFGATTGE